MNDNSENDESTVLKFIQDFFNSYDKNRHILHTLFPEDGTFIVLGNRMFGYSEIQHAILTMVITTHKLFSIDITSLGIQLPEKVQIFQVLCAGEVEIGSDSQTWIYCNTMSLLVYFLRLGPILNILSFNERCLWPKLS